MQKRKYGLIAIRTALLIILLTSGYLFVRYQVFLQQRYHLACEVLKAGMSKDEVISVLKQAGDFTTNEGEWPGGLIELDINFIDPQGRDLYGAFKLLFIDYKYKRAYTGSMFGEGEVDSICDFYRATQSASERSKP